MNFNSVQLAGNLTRDPFVKVLPNSSTKVAELSLAVNRYFKKKNGEVDNKVAFIDLVCYDSAAEMVGLNFSKGDSIFVEGSLCQDRWEDSEGKKRSKVYIRMNNFAKLDKVKNQINNNGEQETEATTSF